MLYLISFLSFLLPTQLGLHFNNFNSTVYGFRIDYLIPTLYLTDLVAFLIIFLGIRKIKFKKSYMLYALCFMVFALLNILVSEYRVSSAYRWLKASEIILLGIVIINIYKFNIFKHFIKPLSYSMFIACVLGIWQFLIKKSVGGLFYWFGERHFLFSDPNVAPYPHSFFSHPNSFAGFLLVFGIFLLQFRKRFNFKYFWVLSIVIAVNLILTNSLNVYITIVVLFFVVVKKSSAFLFLIHDFSQRFVSHRLELIQSSFKMIKDNFWLGVGLNNFIPNLVKVSNTFINAWELQPVHNIFLLILSEVGIVGFVAFCFLLFLSLSPVTYSLLAIVLTGLSDHYWLTLQQNILLFTYVVTISRIKK